jgi:hypothetical protein
MGFWEHNPLHSFREAQEAMERRYKQQEAIQRDQMMRAELDRQTKARWQEMETVDIRDLTEPRSIHDREAQGELKAETLDIRHRERNLYGMDLASKPYRENNPYIVGDPITGLGEGAKLIQFSPDAVDHVLRMLNETSSKRNK